MPSLKCAGGLRARSSGHQGALSKPRGSPIYLFQSLPMPAILTIDGPHIRSACHGADQWIVVAHGVAQRMPASACGSHRQISSGTCDMDDEGRPRRPVTICQFAQAHHGLSTARRVNQPYGLVATDLVHCSWWHSSVEIPSLMSHGVRLMTPSQSARETS